MAKKEATFPVLMQESELKSLVKKGSIDVTEVEAFKELARRRVKTLPQLAGKIIADSKVRPELRNAAAVALGKAKGPSQQKSLIKALSSKDVSLVRKVAASLGCIGDEAALAALEKKKLAPKHPAIRSVGFAKSLISYRLGLGKNLLKPVTPAQTLKVAGSGRATFEPKRVTSAALKKELKQIRDQMPGLTITSKGALKFTCDGCEYFVVFNSDFEKASFRKGLNQRNAIAAAIVKRDGCRGTCYVDEYIMTNPLKKDAGDVIGVRPSGTVVHSGKCKLDDNEFKFSLNSANTTHSVAVDFDGTYSPDKIRVAFSKAQVLVGRAKAQKRARLPKQDV